MTCQTSFQRESSFGSGIRPNQCTTYIKRSLFSRSQCEQVKATGSKAMNLVMIPDKLLVFHGPGRREGERGGRKSCLHMVVHNPSDDWMLFKFRTNAVGNVMGLRPALGFIRPQDHVDIKANLNLDHFPQDRRDLKVLVVSCQVDSSIAHMDLKLAWELIPRDNMRFQKLDCMYEEHEFQGGLERGQGCFLEREEVKQSLLGRVGQRGGGGNPSNWGQPRHRSSNQAVKLPGAFRSESDEATKNATKLQQSKCQGGPQMVGQASNPLSSKWIKPKRRHDQAMAHALKPSTSPDAQDLQAENDQPNCTPLRMAVSILICLALLIYLKF